MSNTRANRRSPKSRWPVAGVCAFALAAGCALPEVTFVSVDGGDTAARALSEGGQTATGSLGSGGESAQRDAALGPFVGEDARVAVKGSSGATSGTSGSGVDGSGGNGGTSGRGGATSGVSGTGGASMGDAGSSGVSSGAGEGGTDSGSGLTSDAGSGGNVGSGVSSGTGEAGTDSAPSDAGSACVCGPNQAPVPTGVNCSTLTVDLPPGQTKKGCTGANGFTEAFLNCGQMGHYVTCVAVHLTPALEVCQVSTQKTMAQHCQAAAAGGGSGSSGNGNNDGGN